MILYGLNTCTLCQRAEKDLVAAGKEVIFRDVRAEPLNDTELAELLAEFGDRLVDKTTNDYRALNMWLKESEADAQIKSNPKLMARPILRSGEVLYLGWDDDVKDAILQQ